MSEPTPRQLEVLIAYIECGSAKGAGARLGLHEQTVKNILGDLRAVFGVDNTAQAFAVAVQRWLIDPDKLEIAA